MLNSTLKTSQVMEVTKPWKKNCDLLPVYFFRKRQRKERKKHTPLGIKQLVYIRCQNNLTNYFFFHIGGSFYFSTFYCIKDCTSLKTCYTCLHIRLEKNLSQKLCICFVMHIWFSKIQAFNSIFHYFFKQFSWTCLSKYTWKYMTDMIKHIGQLLRVSWNLWFILILYLIHSKMFHISYWTKFDTFAVLSWKSCTAIKAPPLLLPPPPLFRSHLLHDSVLQTPV